MKSDVRRMKERYNDRAKEQVIQWSFGGLPCEILRSRDCETVRLLSAATAIATATDFS
ncbi:MAG: hypothetical protein ACLFUH_01610 [Bacteroidales bacterium]